MNLLLIIPPWRTTDALVAQLYPLPLAAVTLGAILQEAGHKVTVKDFLVPAQKHKTPAPASFKGLGAPPYMHYGQPLDDCFAWLNEHAPAFDAVGLFAGQCNLWETSEAIADQIHRLNLPLVVGGPLVTTAPDVAEAKFAPAVMVQGEGETVCVEAFTRAPLQRLNVINGGGALVLRGAQVKPDTLPDWSLVDLAAYPKYKGKVRGVLTVSRGCPHACEFCSVHTMNGRKYRYIAQAEIEAKLLNLWDAGARYFCFLDDNLFFNKKAVDRVLGAIDRLRENIPAFKRSRFYVEEGLEVRIAAVPGIIADIAARGFENIAIGLETMNSATRSTVRKPYNPEQLAAAVANCKAAGVQAKAFYIIGFPGDTEQSVAQDIIEFGTLGLAVRTNNLKLYPGTTTTKAFLDAGYITAGYDWRMSSWHTPTSGSIDYKTVKRLKTVLGAVGKAADEYGVALFGDTVETIIAALERKFRVNITAGAITLQGNIWRPSALRHMLHLLLLRQGYSGAASVLDNDTITAEGLPAPADDIQQAFASVLGVGLNSQSEPAVAVDPEWLVGDATQLAELNLPAGESFDFIFSCPPYYDLEVYSDDPADLSNAPDYQAFLSMYRAAVAQACAKLKPDRFACFVVGDLRDKGGCYLNFVGDTASAFIDAGLRLYNEAVLITAIGSLPIRTSHQFPIGRKLGKAHQNVLVFVKGDPRKAVEALGNDPAYLGAYDEEAAEQAPAG